MIPDYQVTINGDIIVPENTYFLMETSFIKLPALGRVNEFENDNDNINDLD